MSLYQYGTVFQVKNASDANLLQVCAYAPNYNKRGLIILYTKEVIRLLC
jgi:hypothetical protein